MATVLVAPSSDRTRMVTPLEAAGEFLMSASLAQDRTAKAATARLTEAITFFLIASSSYKRSSIS